MKTLDDAVYEIAKWQLKTFPDATLSGAANHLKREAHEVSVDVESMFYAMGRGEAIQTAKFKDMMAEELADVFFMLIQCATLSNTNLVKEIENKLAKNKQRTWKSADEHGVIEHQP